MKPQQWPTMVVPEGTCHGTFSVYRCFDAEGNPLYIGATSHEPKVRLSGHRKKKWWPLVDRIVFESHPTREAMFAAERHAIYEARPKHNIQWNPDAEPPRDPAELAELAYWHLSVSPFEHWVAS